MDKMLAVWGNTHLCWVPRALQGLRGATAGQGMRPELKKQAYVLHLINKQTGLAHIGSYSEPFFDFIPISERYLSSSVQLCFG